MRGLFAVRTNTLMDDKEEQESEFWIVERNKK